MMIYILVKRPWLCVKDGRFIFCMWDQRKDFAKSTITNKLTNGMQNTGRIKRPYVRDTFRFSGKSLQPKKNKNFYLRLIHPQIFKGFNWTQSFHSHFMLVFDVKLFFAYAICLFPPKVFVINFLNFLRTNKQTKSAQ